MAKSYEEIKAGLRKSNTSNESKKTKKKSYDEMKKSINSHRYEIDADYINSFINDTKEYFNSRTDYKDVNYYNHSSKQEYNTQKSGELRKRANYIKAYLNSNKKNMDPEKYSELTSYLDDFYSATESISKGFRDWSSFYSSFKTEDEYEQWKNTNIENQKLLDLDLGTEESRIKNLEANKKQAQGILKEVLDIKNATYENARRKGMTDEEAKAEVDKLDLSSYYNSLSQLGYDFDNNTSETIAVDRYLTEATKTYNRAKQMQEGQKLASVSNPESEYFDKNFDNVSAQGENLWLEKDGGWLTPDSQRKNQIAYLRNDSEAMNHFESALEGTGGAENIIRDDLTYKAAKYMTNDEFAIYNYYIGLGDEESAEKFLKSIENSLNSRQAGHIYDENNDNVFEKLTFGISAGLDQFNQGIMNFAEATFGGNDEYIPVTAMQQASQLMREDLADDGFKIGGVSIGQAAYDLVNTTSNMLPSVLASTVANALIPGSGKVVKAVTDGIGSLTLGASASGNAYQEALNLGYDKDQAKAYGYLVGGSEAGLQYILGGISALGGRASGKVVENAIKGINNGLARAAITLGLNGLSEGTEEALQEILTPFLKTLALDADYSWSDIEWSDVVYSGILGALTSFSMEGTSYALGAGAIAAGDAIDKHDALRKAGIDITDNKRVGELLASARSTGDTKLINLAKQLENVDYSKLSAKEQKAYAKKVSELYSKTLKVQGKGIRTASKDTAKNIAIEKLKANGVEDSKIDKAADVIASMLTDTGKKLTSTEQKILDEVDGLSIFNELNKSKDVKIEKTKAESDALGQYLETASLTKEKNITPIDTSDYDITDDGKTYVKDTGEEVAITGIASVNNGKMMVNLSNGKTENIKNLDISADEAIIYQGILDMGVDSSIGQIIAETFEVSGTDANTYILGVKDAIHYGKIGGKAFLNEGVFTSELTEEMRERFYNIGEKFTRDSVAEKEQTIAKAIASNKGKKTVTGKVSFKGVNRNELNARQKVTVNAIEAAFGTMGIDVVFFNSPVNAQGKHIGKNGSYNPKTNTIELDISAGMNAQDTILFTASHELTHFIKEWSPEKFKEFADFLVKQYHAHGVDVDALVKAKMEKFNLDYDTAFEEVVADSCESFLRDSNLMKTLTALAKQDLSLFERVGLFLDGLIEKLNEAYKGLTPDSRESREVLKMKDCIKELHDMWDEAALVARDNFQNAGGKKADTSTAKEQAREYDGNGNEYWQIESEKDIFKGIKSTQGLKNAAYNYILKGDKGNKVAGLIDGKNLEFIRVSAKEYVYGKASQMLSEEEYKQKMRMSTSIIDLIDNAPISYDAPDHKNHKLFPYGFKNYQGRVGIDDTIFRYIVRVGKAKNGMIFYDINLEVDGKVPRANRTSLIKSSTSNNKIADSKKNVKENSEKNSDIGSKSFGDYADAKTTDGKELFQYRAMENDEDAYRVMLKEHTNMTDTEVNNLFTTIDKAMEIIKDNLEILDYAWEEDIDDRAFNPVKANSDSLYKFSVDFSTMCRKRILQQVIIEELQSALDRAVTKAESIAIRNELMKLQEEGRQIEIACALCYVESARMKSPAQIQKFLDDRGDVVRKYFAAKSNGEIKEQIAKAEANARKKLAKQYADEIAKGDMPDPTEMVGKKTKKFVSLQSLPKKVADEIRNAKRAVIDGYKPNNNEEKLIKIAENLSVEDFTSAKGLENLAKNYPEIFDAYTSYVRNATKSKGTEKDTWWRIGDSQKLTDDLISTMNAENGLRSQSWSDFQVMHLLDYIGATIELSARKAKMQVYTKVPDYVLLMGNTNQMINLSLIPMAEFNGKLDFDSIEGMEFKRALELRDSYHATAGTISIGINNEQIKMLLDSGLIDYVIPYHQSGMSKVVRKEMHIPTWESYESYQSEKTLKTNEALKNAKAYGVKLLPNKDPMWHKPPKFSEWFDVDEARQIAEMENHTPSDPKAQKKYGVMYGAYKAMQNAADNYLKLCAERGLSPKFSHEKADFTKEDNYWKLLIDRKMIDNITGEIIEQKPVQAVFDEANVLKILNDELARYGKIKEDQDYATRTVVEKFLSGDMNEDISKVAAGILEKPVNNVTKVSILNSADGVTKNSMRVTSEEDAAYMDAYFDGDDDLMQELVDKVAYRLGYKYKAFHHTENGFTVFDLNKARANMDIQGFYFSADKDAESEYGSVRYDTYLKMDNPYIVDSAEKRKAIPFDMSKENAGVIAREWLQSQGYDSVIRKAEYYGAEADEYIVFEPSQIKSADPMTFADDEYGEGDVIPLSERFDQFNDDIRYSERDSQGNQLTEAQMEFFKDSKVRDAEGRLIPVYHGTPNKFTVFKQRMAQGWGTGIYFTDNKEATSEFGDNVVEAYLNITNPFLADTMSYDDIGAENTKAYRDFDMKMWEYRAYEYDTYEEYKADGMGVDMYEIYTEEVEVFNKILRELGYDGIIADHSNNIEGLEIVAFENNQPKLITNLNPTEDPDIRYQERDPDAIAAYKKVVETLESENAKLTEDVERLKELVKLQRTETHNKVLSKSSVDAAAKNLMKYANAKGNRAELVKHLEDVYSYILQGENVSWEGVMEKAENAVDWLEKNEHIKTERDEYANTILKDLRTSRFYLDDLQKKEVAYRYGSYNEFRKKTMGRFILTDNAEMSLDSQWQAWAEDYPDKFDKEVSSNDQPLVLMDIIDGLQEEIPVDYYGDTQMNRQDLLMAVYDGYWNVSTLTTFADRKQKEINNLKYKHKEQMSKLREDHNDKTLQLKKEYNEKLAKVREKSYEKQQAIAKHYQDARKKGIENRSKTEFRRKIKGVVNDLDNLLMHGNKERNVKEDMQDVALAMLKSADAVFSTSFSNSKIARGDIRQMILTENEQNLVAKYQETLKRIDKTKAKIRELNESGTSDAKYLTKLYNNLNNDENLAKLYDNQLEDVFERERIRISKVTVPQALKELADAYKSIQKSKYAYISNVYNAALAERLDDLSADEGMNRPFKEMSLEQLSEIYDAYKMVLTSIRDANKTFAFDKEITVEKLGINARSELEKIRTATRSNPALDFVRKQGWNTLKPIYAFRTIGSDTLTKLYENIRKGEDVWYKDVQEAKMFREEMKRKYGYNSWDLKETYHFVSNNGKEFSLTLEQIMSLYALSRRNKSLKHLMQGGIVLEDAVEVKDSKTGKTYKVNTANTFTFTPELLNEVTRVVRDNENIKGYVESMQEYLTKMGDKGNEVSMKLFGVRLFKEKVYFPIKSSETYMNFKPEDVGEFKIKNSSFTNSTNKFANNPIVLSDFDNVWGGHANDMSLYHAFTLPLEDFTRVFNYRTRVDGELGQDAVRGALKNAYGDGAETYIRNLLKDINGGVRSQQGAELANKLISLGKKSSVFASASVVAQQPSAIARAFAHINPKYFANVKQFDYVHHNKAWEELKRYAPVAGIKEMGYFDTGLGQTSVDWIIQDNPENIRDGIKAFFSKDSAYRDEILSKAPALADELTWVSIWEAVKKEVAATYDKNAEDYLKKCGDRFTEIITLTQVYDSVLSRSGFMRSKDTSVKMAVSFMAEPTTTMNMVYDSFVQSHRKSRKSHPVKVITAVLTSVVINALLKALVTAGRDEDEDEAWIEKYLTATSSSLMDDINPLTYIPYAKDVHSIFKGYDIKRMDMTIIAQFADSIQDVSKDTVPIYKKITGVIGAASSIFGVPLKNILRDIDGVVNTVKSFGVSPTSYGVGEALLKGFTGKETTLKDRTWNAYKKGDTSTVKKTVNELMDAKIKSGKTQKEAKSEVRSSFTSTYKEKYLEAVANRDYTFMNEIRKFLYATGLYGSLSELDKTLTNWRTSK